MKVKQVLLRQGNAQMIAWVDASWRLHKGHEVTGKDGKL